MSEVESSLRSGQSGKFAVETSQNMPDESSVPNESTLDDQFSDEEIRAQLEALGYENVPDYQLRLFKADLERLIWYDQQKERDLKSTEEGDDKETSEAESSRSTKPSSRRTPRAPFASYMQPSTDGRLATIRGKHRLQLCEDMGLDFERRSPSPLTSESSRTSGTRHRWHRRKVLRHINGIPTVCEESLTDMDGDDVSVLSDQLSSISIEESKKKKIHGRSRSYTWAPDCPIVNAVLCREGNFPKRPATATAFGKKKKKITKEDYYDEIVRYLPKAFVDNPEGIQPLKKTNPNERFNMYRKMWDHYRIPGESPDLELRWCIRALLLTKRVPDIQTYALKRKEAIDNAKRMKEHKSWT